MKDNSPVAFPSIMSTEMARAIVRQASEIDRAKSLVDANEPPFEIQVITLSTTELGTAKTIELPFKIGFGFRSVFVRDATDSNVQVSLRPYGPDQVNGDIPLKYNDSVVFPTRIPQAVLTWSAQTSKTMTLVFFLNGEFRSGSQVSSTAGGVSVTTGTAMAPSAPVAVGITAVQLLAASSTRKKATIGNPLGSGINLWISGTSAVTNAAGGFPGILLEPGDYYEFLNQGTLFGIASAASVNVTIQTET